MNIKARKTVCIIFTFLLIVSNFIYPTRVEARISFNRFKRVTRRVFRKMKRGTKFVVTLPDRSTRWLGPVAGPIASAALTGNIAKHPRWGSIFNKARRINRTINTVSSVNDQQQYLKDLRNAYRSQATDLRNKAQEIRDSRKNMLSNLTKGTITFKEYKKHVLDLERIAESYEKTADKFDNSADKLKPGDLAEILSRNFVNGVWKDVKNAVIHETSNEISKLVNPDVIKRLISNEGVDLSSIFDLFAQKEIDKQLGKGEDIDAAALKDRVNKRIQEVLKYNREDFEQNWQHKINEIIDETKQELREEKNKLPEINEKSEEEKTEKEQHEDRIMYDPNPDSADECPNGYTWDMKIGKCIQINCGDGSIPNAHYSYVKDCVCGSSGSINENPDDPNKECKYSLYYEACPGCVYSCVHKDIECSESE